MKRADLTTIILERIFADVLKGKGTLLKCPSKGRFIRGEISDQIVFDIFFRLVDQKPPYHFLESVAIEHRSISNVVQEILYSAGTSFDWTCRVGSRVRAYWPVDTPLTVSSETIDEFIEAYKSSFSILNKDFLIKYQDINTLINESTLFYTQWPKHMMPQDVGFSLMGFGILNSSETYILAGRDLLIKKKAQLTGLPPIIHNAIDIMIDHAKNRC